MALIKQAHTHQLSPQGQRKKGHAQTKPQLGSENQFYSGVCEGELVKHTTGLSLLWEEDPRTSKGRSSDPSFAFWSNLSTRLNVGSLIFNLTKLVIAPRSAPHLLYFIHTSQSPLVILRASCRVEAKTWFMDHSLPNDQQMNSWLYHQSCYTS